MLLQKNDFQRKTLLRNKKLMLTSNVKSTLDENMWWRNKIERQTNQFENIAKNYSTLRCTFCCNLVTKLLENFNEKTPIFHQPNINENPDNFHKNFENSYHDKTKCYCSLLSNSNNAKIMK